MLETYRLAVDETLKALSLIAQPSEEPVTAILPKAPEAGTVPQPLRSAMRYSLLLPGKRIRPCLLLASYHLLKDDWHSVLPFACALEMIHTYSLIHDDLPALDDDALRRGKPTNHKVFGEDMAILAGDGLLNMAYETMLTSPFAAQQPALALQAAAEIAVRAGVRGMIAGQTLDVKLEGQQPNAECAEYIHLHKTADLLTAPITAGLMLAGASDAQLEAGRAYGRGIGLAFQIVDDLLDVEGDAALLGKETGMDAQRGKMTWPTVFGVEQARKDAADAVAQAQQSMQLFGERGKLLRDFAAVTLHRHV